MRQPEITKELILYKAGTLFNTKGYKATSISDITKATGLTKGAIYRHFTNKQSLESEAFEYLISIVFIKMNERIKTADNAKDKMYAVLSFFESYIIKEPIKGGCPLLNVAIEVDDSNSLLKQQAQKVLDNLKLSVYKVLDNGIKFKQIKKDTNKQQMATLLIAGIEGALMMSKLMGNNKDIKVMIQQLYTLIDDITIK
jgi:TetR/AcrR family transcriptional regulator, transcriptional repressor for nem operon